MEDGLRVLERIIYATQVRHKVLTSNIANTDTPRYRAKDVDFQGLVNDAANSLRTTDPHHIQAHPGDPTATPGVVESPSWGDDNNVELDMEVAKMTENGLLFESAVKLLTTKINMLKSALGRR
ncbi:MAG: flagellar basal body rod protein FlgB [Nitrospirales bacterium]|nr:flagellar basal body rod protein FlgB [Nitrospirales bacterium]